MNKRKEPTTARESRKARNEVRRGMKEETLVPVIKAQKAKTATKAAPKTAAKAKSVKKHSKRTSPKEKIEGSTPANYHKENEHWLMTLSRQTLMKARSLTKRLGKKH
ncbi:MAG: hypothetical protein K2Y01_07925 [Rhabdochlamydiaceae bacterium]|nr:hypothetical protein [Rhabdochlamydiaceae bacterium]